MYKRKEVKKEVVVKKEVPVVKCECLQVSSKIGNPQKPGKIK